MTHLEVLQACGLTVLHTLWAGTLLGLFFWLLRRLADGASPGLRHGISFAGFFTLAASAPAIFVLCARSLQPEPAPYTGPIEIPLLGAGTVRAALPEAAADGRSLVALLLGSAWAAGSVLFLLRVAVGAGRVATLKRASIAAKEDYWQVRLSELLDEMRVRIPVRLLISSVATSPLVVGVLRPAIVLPASLMTGWTPAQIEMALLHEIAHIRRYDNLVRCLQRVAESILFFHPVIWLLARDLNRDREDCCDAAVLHLRGEPALYAASLYSLSNPVRKLALEASSMADHALLPRIRRILKQESTMLTFPQRCANLGMALGCVCLLILGVQAQTPDSAPVRSDDEAAARLIALGDLFGSSSSGEASGEVMLRLGDLFDVSGEFQGLDPQEEPDARKRTLDRLVRALKEANERIDRLERELDLRGRKEDTHGRAMEAYLEEVQRMKERVEKAQAAERHQRITRGVGAIQRSKDAQHRLLVEFATRNKAGAAQQQPELPGDHPMPKWILEALEEGDSLIIESGKDGKHRIRIMKQIQPKPGSGKPTGAVPLLKEVPILGEVFRRQAEHEHIAPKSPASPTLKYKIQSSDEAGGKRTEPGKKSKEITIVETEQTLAAPMVLTRSPDGTTWRLVTPKDGGKARIEALDIRLKDEEAEIREEPSGSKIRITGGEAVEQVQEENTKGRPSPPAGKKAPSTGTFRQMALKSKAVPIEGAILRKNNEIVPAEGTLLRKKPVAPAPPARGSTEPDAAARRLAEQEREIRQLRQELMELRRLQEELRKQPNRDA